MARGRYQKHTTIDDVRIVQARNPQTHLFKNDAFAGLQATEYIVNSSDRLDHLAARFLNDDRYWYVIAMINDLVSPFLTAGQRLLIPVDLKEALDRL